MQTIFGILGNLFEGVDLNAILEAIHGSLVEYHVDSVIDVFQSFFGGLFS